MNTTAEPELPSKTALRRPADVNALLDDFFSTHVHGGGS